jgi:hypothetical protein
MVERSQELEERIQAQRVELDALIEKRVALYRRQLQSYEQHLYRLPAAQESELKPTLPQLRQRLEALAGQYRSYRDGEPKNPGAASRQIENSLEEFDTAYQKLQSEIQPS